MAPSPEEMQQSIDQLGRDTAAVREKAEADGLLPEDDPAERQPTLADPDPVRADDELPGSATG
ncbi:MAG TPA: hypothetical protein VIL48_09970 [Acidimicrobiales bacterium]